MFNRIWLSGVLVLFITVTYSYSESDQVIAFKGQEYRPDFRVYALVTAYCGCDVCCPNTADNVTSLGDNALNCDGVAVDPKRIKYRTVMQIPGAGFREADDTGGAMRQSRCIHIDLRYKTHYQAKRWGRQWLWVTIYKKNSLPSTQQYYRVAAGDTLTSIAGKFNTKIKILVEYNMLTDQNETPRPYGRGVSFFEKMSSKKF